MPAVGSDADAARWRLLQTAIEMVGENGARATTVRRPAEAVGFSAPLVIFHFGSKKGLLEACNEEAMRTTGHAMNYVRG